MTPDGEIWALTDLSHADLRRKLIELLDTHAEIEFKSLRSKLGLKKPKGSERDFTFNLEAGGEKRLKGNATAVKLRKVLGDDYEKLSSEQLIGVVEDLLEYEKPDALAAIGKPLRNRTGQGRRPCGCHVGTELRFTLPRGDAKAVAANGKGASLRGSKEASLWDHAGRLGLRDFLSPVLEAVPQLRNPVVCRGLTEFRKVVNALVREYGKPDHIRVELARDLKKSRQQREDLTKQNRDNEKTRDAARRKIAERLRCDENAVSNLDILKVRLAEECNWECPYTGRSIAIEALVGKHAQFDIEHIIPFSRSLDNSFLNKTLCYHEENRSVKQNQTPYEAYSGDEKKWQEVLARVRRFRGSAAHAKLRKFQQKELDDDFAARMLQDTRYMSRLATEYLGLLYGGTIDADGRRRVQVSAAGSLRFCATIGAESRSWPMVMMTKRTVRTTATMPLMQ